MLIATILEVSFALSLFAQVNGISPPEKHPIRPEIDLNVALPLESFSPSTLESQEPLAHDQAPNTRFDPTHFDQTLAASSTSRSRKYKWRNTAKEQASLANLRLKSAQRREAAYKTHLTTVAEMEGRLHLTLDVQEKKRVHSARNYFHTQATKARKRVDHTHVDKFKALIEKLPSYSLLRHPPNGPISPELQRKLARANRSRDLRERKSAAEFMKKQFGVERSTQMRRRRKGASNLDPKEAEMIERRRMRDAQKKQEGETQGMVVPQ